MIAVFLFPHLLCNVNPNGDSFIGRITQLDLVGAPILIPSIMMLLPALHWGRAEYA
jgi:hypothetical protein